MTAHCVAGRSRPAPSSRFRAHRAGRSSPWSLSRMARRRHACHS